MRKQIKSIPPLEQVYTLPLGSAPLTSVIKEFYPFQKRVGFYIYVDLYVYMCTIYM